MKITFVTDTYLPQANGVATTLSRLIAGLRERGNTVDLIRPSFLACEEEGMRVPSVALPGYPEVRVGLPIRLLLQYRWTRQRPDIIYVATETPLGASAVNAARAMDIPVATGFHTNFQEYVAHYRLPLLERATLSYLRRLHNRSDATFVPAYDVIHRLEGQGFENLRLLPKGVDTRHFHPRNRDRALREAWGATEDSPVALYVGRIAAEKNLPLIVRSFRALAERHPGFRGVFVGDGPKLKELQAQHPEFIYAGTRFGEDLARHYASADLFIFPSMTETFGNVTLEAMASGLAVVAYHYAAARQHIVDGINSYSAPFGDEEAYLASVLRAAEAPDLAEIREYARSSARKVRWRKVIKHFEKALEEIIETKQRPGHPAAAPLNAELASPRH